MKILTLNLHCFAEELLEHNQEVIADFIFENDIDIIFFQEVAQHMDSPIYSGNIKVGNYGQKVTNLLSDMGQTYYYHYEPGNRAFNDLDEGLAILSKHRLLNKESFFVSRETSYDDWKTRKLVKASVKIDNELIDLVCIHLGWSDENEKFEDQVDVLMEHLDMSKKVIIAGDFNVPEGSDEYKHVISKGFNDLYYNNEEKYFHDVTHQPYIDVKKEAKRIDYIMSNKTFNIINREIVFKEEKVSDHFGVLIEITKE